MNHPVCSLFAELFEFSLFSNRFSDTSKEGKSNAAFISMETAAGVVPFPEHHGAFLHSGDAFGE